MRTTAVRDGEFYVINGVKRFITGAVSADFAQVMAATDRSKGSRGGISCFLVDMDTPGVKVTTQYETMMGDRPCEIVFDNARVPIANRIGEEGEGFKLGQQWISVGRLKHGARALQEWRNAASTPMATSCTPKAARDAFGRTAPCLAPGGAVHAGRFLCGVKSGTTHESTRQPPRVGRWNRQNRVDGLRGQVLRRRGMAFRVCRSLHADPVGGIGLTKDLPIERFWRQQRSFRITEGATEVMKMMIARHLLRNV